MFPWLHEEIFRNKKLSVFLLSTMAKQKHPVKWEKKIYIHTIKFRKKLFFSSYSSFGMSACSEEYGLYSKKNWKKFNENSLASEMARVTNFVCMILIFSEFLTEMVLECSCFIVKNAEFQVLIENFWFC